CQTLWQDFKKKNKAKQGEKISFDMGFIAGIEHNHKKKFKTPEIKNRQTSFLPVKTVKSLIKKNQKNNQIEISRLFPKLKKVKYGRHQATSRSFQEGLKNGKNTHINKSMTHQKKGMSGLLMG
ncbi:MAG: DUF2786 domain-containing protein, partial [archaeon]|nr:DUF2786 domain-containing protein [archaeon]